MKKFLKALLVVVLLAAVSLPLAFLAKPSVPADNLDWSPVLVSGRANTKPEGEKLDITIPADDDAQGHIDLACRLYELANENDKNLSKRSLEVKSVTTTMGLPVNGYRFVAKNAGEYLYVEYSIVDNPIQALILGGSKESTQFAKVQYTNPSLSVVKQEFAYTPTVSTSEDGCLIFPVDWSDTKEDLNCDLPKTTLVPAPDAKYEVTDQKISKETIKEAKVSYDAKGGFYKLHIVLDCENPKTTEKTIGNVRKGANSTDAVYTEIVEDIELWDTGYYKYFISIDKWSGKMNGSLKLNSTIDFRTTYYYDDVSTKLSNIQYYDRINEKYPAKA